jgi:hypothetical protein
MKNKKTVLISIYYDNHENPFEYEANEIDWNERSTYKNHILFKSTENVWINFREDYTVLEVNKRVE